MTWRVLRTELLRGAAPVAAAGGLLVGALMMYSLAGDWSGWPGRWMPFAASVRMSLFVLGAFALACAAWQAGRERRRRIGEQLAGTARPPWQPLLVSWVAVTAGSTAALLVIVGTGAGLVAPVATYGGGAWWWVLAVSFPGLAAMSAVGTLVGRMVPSRMAAPVAGIITYLLMVGAIDTRELAGIRFLAPVLSHYDAPGHMLAGSVSAFQALWFIGLAATVLVLLTARRRWLTAVPAVVAAAGAVPLVAGPHTGWEVDPAALEPVCTDESGAEICVSRMDAFLLDDISRAAQEVLARWDGVPGGPEAVVDANLAGAPGGPVEVAAATLVVQIPGPLDVDAVHHGMGPFSWWPEWDCEQPSPDEQRVMAVLAAWGTGSRFDQVVEDDVREGYEDLLARPLAGQRAWAGRVMDATASCDRDAMARLAAEIR